MASLQAGPEFGGAARDFCNRHRVLLLSVVLCLAGVATGTATAAAMLQSVAILEPALIAAGIVMAAACCAVQTRHWGLSIMTALAPVPGLLWAAPLSAGSDYGAVPFLAYAVAFTVGALCAHSTVERALDRGHGQYPWRAALAAILSTAVLGALWFVGTDGWDAAAQAVADTALSVTSVLVLLPFGASLLSFDESFVARLNRVRERRQRRLERLALVGAPRWGLSFTGIALVFLALGWFGAEPAMRTGVFALALRAVSVGLTVAAAAAFVKGWREGVAITLAVSVACLVTLWLTASVSYGRALHADVLLVAALCLVLSLYGGRRALHFRLRGELPAVAREGAIEKASAGQVFAAAGATLSMAPAAVIWPELLPVVAGTVAAGVGAVVWAPAGAAVLELLVPRHRSVEELYASRKKSHA